jgi:hypothetical protein
MIFLLLLASWLYVSVFHRLCKSTLPDSRIMLLFFQFVSLFLSAEAIWLTWLSLFGAYAGLNFHAYSLFILTDFLTSYIVGGTVPLFSQGRT